VEILVQITVYCHLFQVANQSRLLTQSRYSKKYCVTNRPTGKQQVESVKEVEVTFEKYTWCPINTAQQR